MAIGKYSSGKSTGTSDRKSSGRLSSPGGATGSPIKKFKLEGTTTPTNKLRISQSDYFQAQPLSFPAAPQISKAPEAPANNQNLKNLATAFGDVNTKLQAFTTDFWDFQLTMDKAARKRAEEKAEGEDSNTKLNAAKNALEKKAETDQNAANSYGVFASMDQRVEREYVIVKAKRNGMDVITGFEDAMSEIYQESFLDESRRDIESGKIVPLNPSSPEYTQIATAYFAEKIPNTKARLELQPQIQAVIYSSRKSLSAEHKKYKDNTAIEGKNNAIGTTILDASTVSQETLTGSFTSTEWTTDQDVHDPGKVTEYGPMSLTQTYTDFNQKSGVSMKSYNAQTQSGVILTDVANQVIAVSNKPSEVRKNSDVALTLLMNTKIGTAKLVDMVGGEKKLKKLWQLAIGEKRNEASRILDTAAINNANQVAEFDFGTINDQDANLDTPEIVDPIVVNGMRTVTVKNPDGTTTDYQIPSQGGVNITGVIGKINRLQFDAYNKFATVQEAQAYIKRLEQLKTGFLDSRTSEQREENYQWLLETTSKSPDQAVRNKQLIGYFYRTNRIDQAQYQLLLDGVNPNYTQEKANYNILVNGSGGNEGLFGTADGYITNHYLKKTGMSIKALSRWNKEDRDAYEADKAAFRTKANIIFNKNIPYSQRVAELNQLLTDTKADYQDRNIELKENQTGKSDDNIQVGTNKPTTQINNNESENQSFTYQTPTELVAGLEGGLNGRGNVQQNSALVTAAREDTLYSTPILVQQLNQFEDLALVIEKSGNRPPNIWGWIQGVEATTAVRGPRALSYTKEMPAILGRINKDMSSKEFYLSQMKLHGLPITQKHHDILDTIFPDERNSQFQFEDVKKNNEQASSILDRGTLVAGTNLEGVLPNPKQELETQILDLIHSGESTVDVTGGGYEAFNQGGAEEGKKVLGFSGTYGDHPANKGKTLVNMTIQEILDIQDSGYDTKTYPMNDEGWKKWFASGGIHAAGRYQFTREGLRDAMELAGIKPTEKFTPEVQDKLAIALLVNRGPNLWTSMKGNKELIKLLEQYKKPKNQDSSTIGGRSNIA